MQLCSQQFQYFPDYEVTILLVWLFFNLCKCIAHSSHVWWLRRAWCWHNFLCSSLRFKLIALGLYLTLFRVYQFSSVAQSCLNFCDPMDGSTLGFPVHHQLPELAQTHVRQLSDAINHLILCWPLLLPPSIFPSIRVFPNELALCIRWPKYWSFSFSISSSNE